MKLNGLLVAVVLAFVSVAIPARAQSAGIVQYTQNVYAQGVNPATGSPVWTNTYTASAAVCNQNAVTPGATVVNPTRFEFADAAQPGKVCIVALASSSLLTAIPLGGTGFTSTLIQTDNLGQSSQASAASNPFNLQPLPAVLTGFKLIQ